MGDKRWALIKASEDGEPIRFLSDCDLPDLLEDPAEWGVDKFADEDMLPTQTAYWPEKTAVLIRYEVVIPVPAGVMRLPDGFGE